MVWPSAPESPVKRMQRSTESPVKRMHRSTGSSHRNDVDAPRAAASEPSRLLSEMAPHLMTPAMVNALTKVSLQAGQLSAARDPYPLKRSTLLLAPQFSIENPARSLARISSSLLQFSGLKGARTPANQPMTSMDVGVLEESQRLSLIHISEPTRRS